MIDLNTGSAMGDDNRVGLLSRGLVRTARSASARYFWNPCTKKGVNERVGLRSWRAYPWRRQKREGGGPPVAPGSIVWVVKAETKLPTPAVRSGTKLTS